MNIPIDGSKIYYEKAGQGDVVIFIHADALDSRQWDSQFEYFAKKYTVIRYDIRGFGKSEIPRNTSYSFSEDLNKIMQVLSIKKAHLIGLSLGAAVIVDFALTHPDKVHSLVLADSGISGDGFDKLFVERINEIIDLAKQGDLEKAKEFWLNLNIFDYSRKNPYVWRVVDQMVRDTSGYRWYGKNQPMDMHPRAVERLSSIKVPTLILVGEHDILDFQRKSKLLHGQIKESNLVTIPNAGHLSNMDNPAEFNRLIELSLSGSLAGH